MHDGSGGCVSDGAMTPQQANELRAFLDATNDETPFLSLLPLLKVAKDTLDALMTSDDTADHIRMCCALGVIDALLPGNVTYVVPDGDDE